MDEEIVVAHFVEGRGVILGPRRKTDELMIF
jgi:hypothetical protein